MAPVKGDLNEGCLRLPIGLTEIDREDEGDDDDDADSFSSDSSRKLDFKTDFWYGQRRADDQDEDQDGNTL